MFGLLNISYSS